MAKPDCSPYLSMVGKIGLQRQSLPRYPPQARRQSRSCRSVQKQNQVVRIWKLLLSRLFTVKATSNYLRLVIYYGTGNLTYDDVSATMMKLKIGRTSPSGSGRWKCLTPGRAAHASCMACRATLRWPQLWRVTACASPTQQMALCCSRCFLTVRGQSHSKVSLGEIRFLALVFFEAPKRVDDLMHG